MRLSCFMKFLYLTLLLPATHRERQRQRQTDRQTDRQAGRQTDRQTDTQRLTNGGGTRRISTKSIALALAAQTAARRHHRRRCRRHHRLLSLLLLLLPLALLSWVGQEV